MGSEMCIRDRFSKSCNILTRPNDLDEIQKDIQRELTQIEQLPYIAAEWEPITCVIDSGVVDHVIPKKDANATDIKPNQMTMSGESYVAANGSPIESYGDTVIKGRTDDWTPLNITFNVAVVRKPLISSTRLTECGHKAVSYTHLTLPTNREV